MSRNTKYEALKTKMHLLDIAINEFSNRGYTATTLADIAEAAEVTRGAIYWHFESKAQIFNEIWMRETPIFQQINPRIVDLTKNNPLYNLKILLIEGLKFVSSDPKQRSLMNIIFHKCEFSGSMLSSQEIRERIYINPQRLTSALNWCRDRNQLRNDIDVKYSVNITGAYFTGIIVNWLIYQDTFNLHKDAEGIVCRLVHMLNYNENEIGNIDVRM